MNNPNETSNDRIWKAIDREKKRDAFIKKVSKIAWSVTLFVLLIFLVLTINDLSRMIGRYKVGAVSYESVIGTLMPMVVVLGGVGLIIAILSTIGVFLRLRTTSLMEIQQRLANLEQMITSESK